jgi:hypothetical protein
MLLVIRLTRPIQLVGQHNPSGRATSALAGMCRRSAGGCPEVGRGCAGGPIRGMPGGRPGMCRGPDPGDARRSAGDVPGARSGGCPAVGRGMCWRSDLGMCRRSDPGDARRSAGGSAGGLIRGMPGGRPGDLPGVRSGGSAGGPIRGMCRRSDPGDARRSAGGCAGGPIRECRALARHDIPGYFTKRRNRRRKHDREDFSPRIRRWIVRRDIALLTIHHPLSPNKPGPIWPDYPAGAGRPGHFTERACRGF